MRIFEFRRIIEILIGWKTTLVLKNLKVGFEEFKEFLEVLCLILVSWVIHFNKYEIYGAC